MCLLSCTHVPLPDDVSLHDLIMVSLVLSCIFCQFMNSLLWWWIPLAFSVNPNTSTPILYSDHWGHRERIHCNERLAFFPSPAGMSLTKLSLGGNNLYMTSLFPPRESLGSDIPAGDGNIEKSFLRCRPPFWSRIYLAKLAYPAILSWWISCFVGFADFAD